MYTDFISLYDQYFDDIYRYIFFKTGDKWDTDELVGDVFRKAFEKFQTLKTNPKAWLFTITRNTVVDYYRKKKDIALGDIAEEYAYTYSFELELEKKDELNCLKQSLAILSREELEIVNLRYFSELKYLEIGQLIGKSESSVKMKTRRIIEKLSDLVKKCVEG